KAIQCAQGSSGHDRVSDLQGFLIETHGCPASIDPAEHLCRVMTDDVFSISRGHPVGDVIVRIRERVKSALGGVADAALVSLLRTVKPPVSGRRCKRGLRRRLILV